MGLNWLNKCLKKGVLNLNTWKERIPVSWSQNPQSHLYNLGKLLNFVGTKSRIHNNLQKKKSWDTAYFQFSSMKRLYLVISLLGALHKPTLIYGQGEHLHNLIHKHHDHEKHDHGRNGNGKHFGNILQTRCSQKDLSEAEMQLSNI